MTYIKRLNELNFNSLAGEKKMSESGREGGVKTVCDVFKELTNGRKGQGEHFLCSRQI